MSTDQERLKEILADAAALADLGDRATYLDAACGDDAALRAELESLLAAHEEAGEFLAKSVLPPAEDPKGEGPGTVVGRYKLLEEIGEGTFGRVFVAEQTEPVRRKVALKIVKAGMDTREVVARFEAERQALALMDHPNIAKVHDAGTTEAGRPFFVMELIHGIPVTDYCDQAKLPMAARLEIFLQVCQAVQHAHQKGVIHRDLKPTNILVTEIDGEPVPKIIDFGVAKALGQQLTEKTLYTAFQQIIGTPAYMSPEQTALSGTDVDTRSDIYSLGVLLYELLTGVTPIDNETLHQAGLEEVRRLIRETEPPKPSTRLRTLGPRLAVVARHRQIEPNALTRTVHGDLDWIVMRALEKDRGRRYQTINALAEDLHHHLSHEPVAAGPPGILYRLRKWIRRHRLEAFVTATIAAATVFCIAALGVGMVRVKRERDRAVTAEGRAASEAAISEAVNRFLLDDLLEEASPENQPNRDVKLRTLVDRAADSVADRFRGQPWVELEIRLTLFSVYDGIGEIEAARSQFERALELGSLLPAEDSRQRRIRMAEAAMLIADGRHAESEAILRPLLVTLKEASDQRHPLVLKAEAQLAFALRRQGKTEEAKQLLEKLLPAIEEVRGPRHPTSLRANFNLAAIQQQQGDHDAARALYEEILPVLKNVLGPAHPDTLRSKINLSLAYREQGLLPEAKHLGIQVLADLRTALGSRHPDTQIAMNNLAITLKRLGEPENARELFDELLSIRLDSLGHGHPDTLEVMYELARVHQVLGKLSEARQNFESLVENARTASEPTDQWLFAGLEGLAGLSGSQGDWQQALQDCRKWIAADEMNIRAHRCAALAALMAGDEETYAAESRTMLGLVEQAEGHAGSLEAARTCLVSTKSGVTPEVCARLMAWAVRKDTWSAWGELASGMASYRNGDFDTARKRILNLADHEDSNCAATAQALLVLCHHQLGDHHAAEAALAESNWRLAPALHRGLSLGDQPITWAATADALVMRAEAERALGHEVTPMVDATALADAREAWKPIREALKRGKEEALEENWTAAARAFNEATRSPSFNWALAKLEVPDCWGWMGETIARCIQGPDHETLYTTISETIELAHNSAFRQTLQPCLLARRNSNPALTLRHLTDLYAWNLKWEKALQVSLQISGGADHRQALLRYQTGQISEYHLARKEMLEKYEFITARHPVHMALIAALLQPVEPELHDELRRLANICGEYPTTWDQTMVGFTAYRLGEFQNWYDSLPKDSPARSWAEIPLVRAMANFKADPSASTQQALRNKMEQHQLAMRGWIREGMLNKMSQWKYRIHWAAYLNEARAMLDAAREEPRWFAKAAGSQGNWPQALKHCREWVARSEGDFLAHRCAALAALMAGDREGCEAECAAMLAQVGIEKTAADVLTTAETCLVTHPAKLDLIKCLGLAELAQTSDPDNLRTRLAAGMALHRTGHFEEACQELEDLVDHPDQVLAATAHGFLALSQRRLGHSQVAKQNLAEMNDHLHLGLQRGSSLGDSCRAWADTAAVLAIRAEVERAIHGREVSSKVDAAFVAELRAKSKKAESKEIAGAVISVRTPDEIKILPLRVGEPRLYDSHPLRVIEGVSGELIGWQFTSVPQRIINSYTLTVRKPGDVYCFGNPRKTPSELFGRDFPKWIPDESAISGIYINRCYKRRCAEGDEIQLEGFEIQLSAGEISQ